MISVKNLTLITVLLDIPITVTSKNIEFLKFFYDHRSYYSESQTGIASGCE